MPQKKKRKTKKNQVFQDALNICSRAMGQVCKSFVRKRKIIDIKHRFSHKVQVVDLIYTVVPISRKTGVACDSLTCNQ